MKMGEKWDKIIEIDECSYRIMMLHDDLEGGFDIGDEDVSVFDVDAELSFDGFVDLDGGFNVDVSSFVSPVGHEGDGDSLA